MPKRPAGQNKKDTKISTLQNLKLHEKILDLRIAQRKPYAEIAKIVDADEPYCCRVVSDYMEEVRKRNTDKTEHMVLMDVAALDEAIGVMHRKILREGDTKAATAMTSLMARKAALLGADKAVKFEVDAKKAYVELSLDAFKPDTQPVS